MSSIWFDSLHDPVGNILASVLIIAVSGLPGLVIRRPGLGQIVSVVLSLAASLLGMIGVFKILAGATASRYLLLWPLPFDNAELSVDHLSALFLLPLLLASSCCSLYGRAYLSSLQQPTTEKRVTLFLGLFSASMAMVLIARNGVLLLVSWEVMALSSWMLLVTNLYDHQVQRPGLVYLLATHTGTMALYLFFSLLHNQCGGSFVFPTAHTISSSGSIAVIMMLAALIGFGAKAGIMPLHFWLPGAHANAPSHISALMSGIMLKIGLYGLLRGISFFQTIPLWFGWLVLLLGAVSAITGIVMASAQRDLKRLLACSSIENVGIIVLGLGMAFVGMASKNEFLIIFGLTGGLLHIVNHALFKPLLFLGSGSIIHATGTRQIDRMGGLSRLMPRTAPLFLVGSLAICGLPPFNGFVGELFLYLGAFHEGIYAPLPFMAFIAPLLALVGGVAVITFVKLYGMIFLGVPRDPTAAQGHEAPGSMVLPMAVFALLCIAGGLLAPLLVRLVVPVVTAYSGLDPLLITGLVASVPLATISLLNGLLLCGIVLLAIVWRFVIRRQPVVSSTTWGCGYLAPTARIQYTGSSFSEMAHGILGGSGVQATRLSGLSGYFPASLLFTLPVVERILDRLLIPAMSGVDWCFSWMRRMQNGHVYLYMLYIFVTLFVLMVWSYI